MTTRLTWYSAALPSASPLVFDAADGSEMKLMHLTGLDPLTVAPIMAKGPSQEGETALDVGIPPRVIVAQARVDAADMSALWSARATIARALTSIPVRFGEELELGRLLIERPSLGDREIYAMPRSAKINLIKGAPRALVDAEFLCPYPYPQDTADSTIASIAVDASETAANSGDVDAPMIARIYGPATELTLTNLTTGEAFTVAVSLADDSEWLEVDTTPGVKSVRKYTAPATWTNAIAGLDLATARLFLLRPGNNSIKLEGTGTSGDTYAAIVWRNRYAGL